VKEVKNQDNSEDFIKRLIAISDDTALPLVAELKDFLATPLQTTIPMLHNFRSLNQKLDAPELKKDLVEALKIYKLRKVIENVFDAEAQGILNANIALFDALVVHPIRLFKKFVPELNIESSISIPYISFTLILLMGL